MRHLEVHDLWIQEVIKNKYATIHKVNGQDNPADLFTKHLPRESIIRNMSRLGFRLIDQKNQEIGNKDVDRSWQIEADHEDQDDHEAGIEECMAICERVYGSFIGLVSGKLTPTRATSVKIGTVMSPSPTVDQKNPTAHSESWTDIVKKTPTHSATTSSAKVSLTSRPTCSSFEVKKIMREAAERAAQVILEDVRRKT